MGESDGGSGGGRGQAPVARVVGVCTDVTDRVEIPAKLRFARDLCTLACIYHMRLS